MAGYKDIRAVVSILRPVACGMRHVQALITNCQRLVRLGQYTHIHMHTLVQSAGGNYKEDDIGRKTTATAYLVH